MNELNLHGHLQWCLWGFDDVLRAADEVVRDRAHRGGSRARDGGDARGGFDESLGGAGALRCCLVERGRRSGSHRGVPAGCGGGQGGRGDGGDGGGSRGHGGGQGGGDRGHGGRVGGGDGRLRGGHGGWGARGRRGGDTREGRSLRWSTRGHTGGLVGGLQNAPRQERRSVQIVVGERATGGEYGRRDFKRLVHRQEILATESSAPNCGR
mmetsp:Transcript_6940/g.11580  ORF Transcript_6940/g.11580 Transcript_6940/m.11580 type:complete len:210 (+) Transcript_6940:309-938(+)